MMVGADPLANRAVQVGDHLLESFRILVQPAAKQLRKRCKRGWPLSCTVNNGPADVRPTRMVAIPRLIQEMEYTSVTVESNRKKQPSAKADNQ